MRARASLKSIRPTDDGSSPSTMFSRTVSWSASMKCWWTMPMPAAMASFGERNATGSPLTDMVPSSGGCIP